MPKNILLLHLDEPDGVLLSDAAGNLADLMVDLGSTAPASVDSWTGKGREFVASEPSALVAGDLDGRDTLLLRDMTIQAILSLNLTGAGKQVLLARGLNDGTASERHAFGLELEEQAGFPGFVEARWFWQDSTGTIKVQPPGVWRHLGDGKFFLLTVTRRWESASKVVLRYYVGDELIAELESVDGDISSGTTGHMTLGARQVGGAWEHGFNGVLDELLVTDHEMSPEEVRHTWRRLSEFQPGGVDTFVGLIPPGLPWAKNPGNAVGRHVKHAGLALGFVAAGAEELRAMFLADAAPLGVIERWEKLCKLVPRPTDSLDRRRARVVGYLSREEGFRHEAIKIALAELAGVTDPDDLEILEFENKVTDGFDDDESPLDNEKWSSYGTGGDTTIVTTAGQLALTLEAGTDVRWSEVGLGVHTRSPLNRGDSIAVHARAKLAGWVVDSDVGVGMFLHNFATRDTVHFGVFSPSGDDELGYRLVRDGAEEAWVTILDPAPATCWLRITPPSDTPGEWTLSYSVTGPDSGFVHTTVAIGERAFDWVGFGFFGTDTGTFGSIPEAQFDDLETFCPDGLRPFNWYVFLDPLLGAEPDVDGALALVRKIKPAHTRASFTTSKSVIPDDPLAGLPERAPCGGW
jgi:hypothetical protein